MATLHKLEIVLARLEEKVDGISEMQKQSIRAQESHDKKDSERFSRVHARLDGINKYAASIAVVAGSIGTIGGYILDMFKKGG